MFQSINNTSSLSTEFDKDIMRHTRTSEFRSRIEREQSHIDSLNHDQLRYWIINNSKLPDAISIANKLFDQCIDGKLLVDMTENDFSQLGLNFRSRNLLRSISNSQNEVCKTIETKSPKVRLNASKSFFSHEKSDTESDEYYGHLIVLGYRV